MSRIQADQTRQRLRRSVVRMLRWGIGGTKAWELAKRLGIRVELRILARQLSISSKQEHRQVARRLADALSRSDERMALTIGSHARQEPDLRAEKIISHRYRFMWMCVPKVASRSMIRALLQADPEAVLLREKTVSEIFSIYPEAREFYRFAFVRDPCDRARSLYADKIAGHCARDRFVGQQFHGLRKEMAFADYCEWLDSPFGSDIFAERHWLSQHKQILVGGKLPDYIGSYDNLEANWRWVLAHLGVPYVGLPHLNKQTTEAGPVDDASAAILRRRYSCDFGLVVKVDPGGLARDRQARGYRQ